MNYFLVLNYVVYFLYIVAYLGIWNRAPEYLDYLRTLLKLYVGIVLVLTFNPFINLSSGIMNRQIAFSAGIFILTGLSLDKIQGVLNYLQIADALDLVLPGLVL
jgi:hypothetical protein